jgi:amino acid adenylation domain-containing protein
MNELRSADIRIWADGEQLRFDAPEGAFTEELRDRVRAAKPELLRFLREVRQPGAASGPIPQISRDREYYELSGAQRRLWFLQQLEPDSPVYNIPVRFLLHGHLDVDALRRSLDEIYFRHEGLRATFQTQNGNPVQRIAEPGPMPFELREAGSAAWESIVESTALEQARISFDLQRGPLVRAVLLRRNPDESALFLTMHHLVSDGWSLGVLMRELETLYRGGSPEPLRAQCIDFAAWHNLAVRSERIQEDLHQWADELRGELPVFQIPGQAPRPAVPSSRGEYESVEIPAEIASPLRRAGSLFSSVLAAWAVLLHRYSGQEELTVGFPVAGRSSHETESLIGLFINTLVIRIELGGNPSFAQVHKQIQSKVRAVQDRADVPYDRLLDELQPDRTLSYNPLFQVLYSPQSGTVQPLALEGLEPARPQYRFGSAKVDLTLYTEDAGDDLVATIEYAADVYEPALIRSMCGHLRNLLEAALRSPGTRICSMPMLSTEEQAWQVKTFNETQVAYNAEACVHRLIEVQVDRSPDAIALHGAHEIWTYRQMDERANGIAAKLLQHSVTQGNLVAVCLPPTPDAIAAILGVMKSGAGFVPLDPNHPPERLAQLARSCSVSAAITTDELLDTFSPAHAFTVAVEPTPERPRVNVRSDEVLYAIFTSGSTGVPKAAAVTHRGFVNLLHWFTREFKIDDRDRFLLISPMTFDLTHKGIFGPLTRGAEIHLPESPHFDVKLIRRLTRERGITALNCAPSAFYPIVEDGSFEDLASLRRVFLGGEKIAGGRLRAWLQSPSCGAEVINTYGPTEATDICAFHRIGRDAGSNIPIGRPVYNTQLLILGKHLELKPAGAVGELCVGGDGVGLGYLNSPELTAERFVASPFRPGARLYRTGDLCRFRHDGVIEMLGRADNQVKVRGCRVELEEVDSALRNSGLVRDCAAVVRPGAAGETLAAFFVPAEPSVTASALRAYAAARLPDYMVPSSYVALDSLPRNGSGKTDRRKLAGMSLHSGTAAISPSPLNESEEAIAGIWKEILGLPAVGLDENFFEVGGSSLLIIRSQSAIEAKFSKRVSVVDLFRNPTIRLLADHMSGMSQSKSTASAVASRSAQFREALARQSSARRSR